MIWLSPIRHLLKKYLGSTTVKNYEYLPVLSYPARNIN